MTQVAAKHASIIHFSNVHAWNDVRVFHKQCQTLAAAGYRTTLIARGEGEGGRVEIRPLPRRSSRCSRMTLGIFDCLRLALAAKADLYHFHDSELIPVGLLLKLLGKRVVYDVHEDVPRQILSKSWIPRPLRPAVSAVARAAEWLGACRFDGIVAATPSIASRFPAGKTALVQNFPIIDELNTPGGPPYARRPMSLLYAGGIARDRGIVPLVQAVGRLTPSLEAQLVLAGAFHPASLEQDVQSLAPRNRVDFRGWCSRDELSNLMSRARVGVVTFLPAPNHVAAQPNKLFEYMSAGLPVVASHFPLWREIVDGVGCGLLVDPEDSDDIARALRWLLEHPAEAEEMGRRGRQAVQTRYNWDTQSRVLLEFCKELLHEENCHRRGRTPAVRQSGDRQPGPRRAA